MAPAIEAPVTANGITNALLLRISERYQPYCLIFRLNVTGMVAGTQFIRSAPKGTSDIIGTIYGYAVAIEVKAGKDTLNPDQKRFREQWLKAGGIHLVARDVDRTMSELNAQIKSRCA